MDLNILVPLILVSFSNFELEAFVSSGILLLLNGQDEEENERKKLELLMSMVVFKQSWAAEFGLAFGVTILLLDEISFSDITRYLFPDNLFPRSQPRRVYQRLVQYPHLFWALTSETPATFLQVHADVVFEIMLPRNVRLKYLNNDARIPRACLLCTLDRLLLVLIWLRKYPSYDELATMFGINRTSISDDIHHIVPILYCHFQNEIQWPTQQEFHELRDAGHWPHFPNAVLAVDGTIHRVWKPLINQREYYRGDKRCHFIESQVIVDPTGIIRNLETGYKGSMNDMGNWNVSDAGNGLLPMPEWARILADGGYANVIPLIIPYRADEANGNEEMLRRNEIQRGYRSIVEKSIGVMKHYKSVSKIFVHPKPFQGIIAYLVGCLANRKMKLLRNL